MRIPAQLLLDAQSYARPVVDRILRRYPNDVDDVLQDALTKALIGITSFRGDSSFHTWFTTIAVHLSLMHLRKAKRSRIARSIEYLNPDDDDPKQFFFWDRRPTPFDMAIRAEQAAVLHEEIEKLTPRLRQEAALYLADIPCGIDGVRKSRRHRIRKILRQRLFERNISC